MTEETLVERILKYLKNTPLVAGAIVGAMFLTATAELISLLANLPVVLLKSKSAIDSLGFTYEGFIRGLKVVLVILLLLGIGAVLALKWFWDLVIAALVLYMFVMTFVDLFHGRFLYALFDFIAFHIVGSVAMRRQN